MDSRRKYKIAVIGGGSAGISAAKECINQGIKAVLIERGMIGGVCLNSGCIPTKFYLRNAAERKETGILFQEKESLTAKLRNSASAYLKAGGVDIINSEASFKDKHTIITDSGEIDSEFIIIASGSSPAKLGFLDSRKCFTPEEFLNSSEFYDSYLIVGGGAVGVEYSFLLSSLGRKVVLAEKGDRIIPSFDREISLRLMKILQKRGIDVLLNCDVSKYDYSGLDKIIVSIGRLPNLSGFNIENAGLLLDKHPLKVNDYLQTEVPNIYISGDALGNYLYAYTAEYEGKLCVRNIGGMKEKVDYKGIPHSIFTVPSAAFCGITQEKADKEGIEYKIDKYSIRSSSGGLVYSDNEGFIKLLTDKEGYILGAHIISNIAHEIIGYFAFCIRNHIKYEAIKNSLFIHPTISEHISKIQD